mgnify:CR=1 FL=1
MSNPHIKVDHLEKLDNIRYDYIVKVIIIGDVGVGKSSILRMFTDYKFDQNSNSTIGIDFETAFMEITHLNDRNEKTNNHPHDIGKYLTVSKDTTGLRKQIKHPVFKFQVWDCAGQEKFHSIVKSYIRGAHIIIYAFDITDRYSFSKLNKWRQSVETEAGLPGEGKYMSVVVGNKLDMEKNRQVSLNEGKELAASLDTIYAEVSAKEDQNIQRLFQEITRIMYCKLLSGEFKMDHKSIVANHQLLITTSKESNEDDSDKCLPGKCVIV